ncbi:abortive infection family protein [Neorhizobium galegae]|uniref:abortive infection family protein n=1 Tax=Neorhizobium galegae TaxID=399 RepID=UPI0020363BC9|nr:abortive infection family protein [Neorhizobium galegae]MCM2501970.1 abortive infection family protein [Neorhizobium galegae]MCQ1799696.1 abortive infection family protein [Neorhizobium galegae]
MKQLNTEKSYPIALVRDLRKELASVISDFSANDVPSLCSRLGLPDGDRDESFKSKFKYAQRRLLDVPALDLVGIADRLLDEIDSFVLSEAAGRLRDAATSAITELTRRRILALFEGAPLVTELEHMEFLNRVLPLKQMPSIHSYSDRSLEDDVFQATVRNDDWTNRELLTNIGLLTCSQSRFFQFVEEVTSPLAQTSERQTRLVKEINEQLRHDGYRLEAVRLLSGSPVYKVRISVSGSPSDVGITAALAEFDPETVQPRWTQALERRDTDPEGAITLARTLLEDVCKWILHEAGEAWEEKDDLPVLYRKLAKVLKLAPDDHTEAVFKAILGSCQNIVESLGSLRNRLSDAHSPGPKRVKPAARHAQLSVNLSGTMATFLVSTWQARKEASP